MPTKRYKPEQIVTLLRQIEVEMANGKTTPQACKEAEITAVGAASHTPGGFYPSSCELAASQYRVGLIRT